MKNLAKQAVKWTTTIALSCLSTAALVVITRLTWEGVYFIWHLLDPLFT